MIIINQKTQNKVFDFIKLLTDKKILKWNSADCFSFRAIYKNYFIYLNKSGNDSILISTNDKNGTSFNIYSDKFQDLIKILDEEFQNNNEMNPDYKFVKEFLSYMDVEFPIIYINGNEYRGL